MSFRMTRALAFILLATLLMSCGGKDETPDRGPRPVRTMTVEAASALEGREFPGRAEATREVNMSFRVSGPLVALPISVGDVVKKGQLLAKIDPRDFEVRVRSVQGQLATARAELKAMEAGARPEEIAQLKAEVERAQAAVRRATGEYERIKRIRAKDSGAASARDLERRMEEKTGAEVGLRQAEESLRIGQAGARAEDVEAKQAAIRSLQASLDAAKDQLEYTELRAPFAGSIAAKFVKNFQTVQAQEPIVRLLDTSKIELTVQIPETYISMAEHVDNIKVEYDAFPGRQFDASVKTIGTEANQTTRTFPVTLIMDQADDVKVQPGMAGRARGKVPEAMEERVSIQIPVTAVFADENDQSFVWIFKAGKVQSRKVSLGEVTPFGIAVLEGLGAGDTVVTAGVHRLAEGQAVKLLADGDEGP